MAEAKKGRPTRYRAAFVDLAFWIARAGSTDVEIAEELGISERTLYNWKERHPEFLQAIKRGKELPDARVEQSLYQRALGYDYEESKVVADKDKKVKRVEKTKKFVPPDVTACIFWLKNRMPEKWRDRHEHELEHTVRSPLVIVESEDGPEEI